MKLRNLKSFFKRHYDINGIEKREKKIWKETTITNKLIALSIGWILICLLYTSPSPRDKRQSRMPSSA